MQHSGNLIFAKNYLLYLLHINFALNTIFQESIISFNYFTIVYISVTPPGSYVNTLCYDFTLAMLPEVSRDELSMVNYREALECAIMCTEDPEC